MATVAAFSDHFTLRDDSVLADARQELEAQAQQLARAAGALDQSFVQALDLVVGCTGRVVVSGIGKSGIVARKTAATMACTGTPALFLHPSEAAHGDLGIVTESDVVLLISYSGETGELLWLLPRLRELEVPIVVLTGDADSTLAQAADVVIEAAVEDASAAVPTASALVSQAIGDALAIAAMRARDLTKEELASLHPGSPSGAPPSSG